MPLRSAMGLQHSQQVGRNKSHELGRISRVWGDRPEQRGRLAPLDKLEPQPLCQRGKGTGEVQQAVTKSPSIEN